MPLPSQNATKRTIPHYSQHLDIREPEWRPKSCGVVATGMIFSYWKEQTSPEELLREALFLGAYVPGIGWAHRGLALMARKHGFYGKNFDWFKETSENALKKLKRHVSKYPVIASIHKHFRTENGGHLIVVTKISDGDVSYHEPDSRDRDSVEKTVPLATFQRGWKRRVIIIKPKKLPNRKAGGTISDA